MIKANSLISNNAYPLVKLYYKRALKLNYSQTGVGFNKKMKQYFRNNQAYDSLLKK